MSDPTLRFNDDDEIRTLVEAFETCRFHPSEFKHYQHLTVALWYVSHLPFDEAAERTRTGIRRLAATYGKTGYHETITEFWLRAVRSFLGGARRGESVAILANRLIDKYVDKNLINEYYSAELLASTKAKDKWVEPDLKRLDF
jgi:hypothetical protein